MTFLSQTAPAPSFRFGGFELDPGRATLLHCGVRVKLQPQPFRVLHYLVAAAPAIVSRERLADAIWPDVHVDLDQSLNFCIRQIRAALNDSAAVPRFIETLPKQGYRFIAAIESADPLQDAPEPACTTTPPAVYVQPVASRLPLRRRLRFRPLLLATTAVGLPVLVLVALVRHSSTPVLPAAPSPLHLATPAARPTPAVLPEAHEAYLQGRYLWFRGANEEAGQAFRRSIQLQPGYALAWSGLADFYGQGAGGTLDPRDALPREESAARKAVQLDPASAEAHLSLGAAFYFNRWDFPAAQQEIDRSLELNPHLAQAFHLRAKVLSALEQHTEAIAAERTAAEIDPFARPWAMATRFLLARRYDDARRSALDHLRAEPNSRYALESLEAIDRDQGRVQQAVALRAQIFDLTGDHAAATRLRNTFARGGYRAVLLFSLAGLKQAASQRYVSPFELATLYVQLGDHESALRFLEKALSQRHPDLLLVQNMAIFDPLHNDPRYRSLIRSIGLPPAF